MLLDAERALLRPARRAATTNLTAAGWHEPVRPVAGAPRRGRTRAALALRNGALRRVGPRPLRGAEPGDDHVGRVCEIDAVAQVAKNGFTCVFDRVTGEPMWPISRNMRSKRRRTYRARRRKPPQPPRPSGRRSAGTVPLDNADDLTPESPRAGRRAHAAVPAGSAVHAADPVGHAAAPGRERARTGAGRRSTP